MSKRVVQHATSVAPKLVCDRLGDFCARRYRAGDHRIHDLNLQADHHRRAREPQRLHPQLLYVGAFMTGMCRPRKRAAYWT
jgi:hypothetical protein